ncbi:toll/interleukin-1 receptor domain-containing protein [Geodermatophilus sp. URMC 61]|uniref:toll/interleukin-1 receptor domain-containing protein n=1 Tax=Geodermatophilus sp. URMC 61 TaxID=3423411 RepID=UPI00406BEED7
MSGPGTDSFISHAGRDTAWAEWLAWQLQQAGYRVELAVWDWAPGEDFVTRMQQALERAGRLLAVCTEAYFASAFGGAELRAAFAQQAEGRIVPVLIEPVRLPPLYAPLIHLDLTGLDETTAAARLRARLTGGRPTAAPPFPRAGPAPTDKPGFAGALPAVWRVPPRNPRFTGGTACSPSCAGGCIPARARWWCRRSTASAGWARPSWPWSTPTGSPPTTTWCGGLTPNNRC